MFQRGLGERSKTQVELKEKARKEREEEGQKLRPGIGLNPCYIGPQIKIVNFLALNMHAHIHTKKHVSYIIYCFKEMKANQ